MFPFHTWLPDAHVQAPTAGSVILAAIMLKLGGYGFIRFALPLFPDAAHTFAPAIIVLSLIAIIYGAIVALVQPDLKKLVAYSSVSHMGFVTLGIFVFNQQGVDGAILQMVNHGLITGALFLLVGVIYERTHDRTIAKMGGLAARDARLRGDRSASSSSPRPGCPGLSGFVGEFLVLVGAFAVRPWVAADRHVLHDPRRRLPALDVPARRVRRAVRVPQGPRPPPDRHDPDRDPDAGAAGRPDGRLRPLPGPRPRPHPGLRHGDPRRAARQGAIAIAPQTAIAIALPILYIVGRDRVARIDLSDRAGPVAGLDRDGRGGRLVTLTERMVVAPLIAAIATALAILLVDLVFPRRPTPAIGVALAGLAITAAITVAVGAAATAARPRSAAPTSSTR